MTEERFVAVGIDISDDVTQVAYFVAGMEEPQMIGDEYEAEEYLIPTAIEQTNDGWVIGKACENPVVKLCGKADYGIKQLIGDYDAAEVLAIFAAHIVKAAHLWTGEEKFSQITIALPKTDRVIIEAIRKYFTECGLCTDELVFITHAESCIYYVLNQKKELRVNDVAFFDFSEEGLLYRKLHMARPEKYATVEISEKDCTVACSFEERNDEAFKQLVTELFEKQQISTVYLVGEGFNDTDWAKDSLNIICNRRRVFKGRNLHAIGACYKSMNGYDKYSYEAYCILCNGRTSREMCMEVVFKEERNEAVLIPAGALWYDAQVSVEGILYNTDRIGIVLRTATGEPVKSETILLEEFPHRKDRMTRVKVEVTMLNENEAQITVSDLGFGDFVTGSGEKLTRNIQY